MTKELERVGNDLIEDIWICTVRLSKKFTTTDIIIMEFALWDGFMFLF